MLRLDDCFTTTIMPQPVEITQFIFSQSLKANQPTIAMMDFSFAVMVSGGTAIRRPLSGPSLSAE
jgi:hypothetical protein